jgi:catecholate siderophore receptor
LRAGSVPGTGLIPATGPRGHSRDTRNAIAISQTDLTSRFSTGSIEHALVTGVSISHESFDLDSGAVLRNADGSPATLPLLSIADRTDSLVTPRPAHNYYR